MKISRLLTLWFLLVVTVAYSNGRSDCTGNEAWLPVGGGLSGPALTATTWNNSLYVLHRAGGSNSTMYTISSWNGSFWATVTTFAADKEPRSLAVYSGNLYMGGMFTSIDGVSGTTGLVQWTTAGWKKVGSGIDGWVSSMAVYKGELYVAGNFTNAGGVTVKSLARWDGSVWNDVGGGVTVGGNRADVNALAVFGNELYVGGSFWEAGSYTSNSTGLARWDGKSLAPVGGGMVMWPEELTVYKNELYIAGKLVWRAGQSLQVQGFARWTGTAWKGVGNSTYISGETMTEYDGNLYAAGGFAYGRDTTTRDTMSIDRWDGNAWSVVSNFDDLVRKLIVYNGDLYALGDFGASCGLPIGHIARLCTDKNCARITGTVFHDEDGDCTMGTNESGLSGRVVEILPGPRYAYTDARGLYSQYVDAGSYTLSLTSYPYWALKCPTTMYSVTLTSPGETAANKDFATEPIPGIQDLRVSLAGGRPRPGFSYSQTIRYENAGTATVTPTIRFEFDPGLTFESADVSPTRTESGRIEWDVDPLPMGAVGVIHISLKVPSTVQLGTELCSVLSADPLATDSIPSDNRDSVCQPVRGSYDPNDIAVSPVGYDDGEGGEPMLAASDTVLSYMIRFQNTGTDTALAVVVVDTVDTKLFDITTVRPGAAAHPYTFAISGNGVLTWTFADIMLPDSNIDEPGSHGYLKYTVHLKHGLASGTNIANRAGIYFDYNDPVITNTVVSTIGFVSAVPSTSADSPIRVFPNPSDGRFHLGGIEERGARIEVLTMLGQRVREYSSSTVYPVSLDLSDLPAGTYLLRTATRDGVVVRQIAIVR